MGQIKIAIWVKLIIFTYHLNTKLLVGGLLLIVEGTHTHGYLNCLSHIAAVLFSILMSSK